MVRTTLLKILIGGIIAANAPLSGNNASTARVTASALKIRTEPRMDAEVITIAKRNDLITIQTVSRNYSVYEGITAPWLEVSTATGKNGWAFGGYLQWNHDEHGVPPRTYQLYPDTGFTARGTEIILKKTPLLSLPCAKDSGAPEIPAGESVRVEKRFYGVNEITDGRFWYQISYQGNTGYIDGSDCFLGQKTEGDSVYGTIQKPLRFSWMEDDRPHVIKHSQLAVYSLKKKNLLQQLPLQEPTNAVSFTAINPALAALKLPVPYITVKQEWDRGGWPTAGLTGWKLFERRDDGTLGKLIFTYYEKVFDQGQAMIEQTALRVQNDTIEITYDYIETAETSADVFTGILKLAFTYTPSQQQFTLRDISSDLKLSHASDESEERIKAGLGEPKRQLTREWLNQLVSELTKGDPFIP